MQKIIDFIKGLFGKKSSSSDSSDSSGFTLIELLIVIAVIGILAAALLVAIDPIDKIRAGNDTKVINDVRAIYDAANRHYTVTYEVPTEAGWTTELTGSGELKTIPTPPNGYGDSYTLLSDDNNIVVYGEAQSKSNLAKANDTTSPAYFVATSGGGCFLPDIPLVGEDCQ